jgi:fibro-slime domain-containing protein
MVDSGGTGGHDDGAHAGERSVMGGGTTAGSGGSGAAAGDASEAGETGAGGSPEPTCRPALPVTFRDFNPYGTPSGHEDFEVSARGVKNNDGTTYQGWNDVGCGLVEPLLGVDRKPRVFTGTADAEGGVILPGLVGRQRRVVTGPGCLNGGTAGECNLSSCRSWDISPPTYSIKSGSTFAQWFNTVEGVNIEIEGELVLTETSPSSGAWSFYSDAFFPLDGAGFGNSPGLAHNYSFTTEAHVTFTYLPGQQLKFRGDDDLWLFVNGKLALDLGGQHQPLSVAVDLDAQAAALGIVPGQTYALDLFHAERQSTLSTFYLATNIACFEPG